MDNFLKDKAQDLIFETREDKSIHQLAIKCQSKTEKKVSFGQVSSLFCDQGSNSHPLHWYHQVPTTGSPGKSPQIEIVQG